MSDELLFLTLGVVLALFAWWLWMLIDAIKMPTIQWQGVGQSQAVYIVLMALSGVIGTILYVAIARPRLRCVGAPPSKLAT